MKYLKHIFGFFALLCCANLVFGQNEVSGTYKGHRIKVRYYRGNPDIIQSVDYSLVTELNKTISRLEKEKAALQKKLDATGDDLSNQDSLQMQMLILERDKLAYKHAYDSLDKQEEVLLDSLRILRKILAEYGPGGRDVSPPLTECSHFGVNYSIGIPIAFGSFLSQKDISGQSFWKRRMTLAHQVGIYWGSRSLSKKGSFTLGVGLEYSKMRYAVGVGQFSDTLDNAMDNDHDNYTAYLTCRDLEERATMHYLSIPLSLSVGQPFNDRVSGYLQLALVPSLCLSSSLSLSGYYDLEGYYSAMDLTLNDFQPLGFGHNLRVGEIVTNSKINRFLLNGRLACGFYLPLCRTQQGKKTPWVAKLGVKLDFSITPVAKASTDPSSFQNATDYLSHNNFMTSGGFRYVNPALEIGIMYIIGTKNLK